MDVTLTRTDPTTTARLTQWLDRLGRTRRQEDRTLREHVGRDDTIENEDYDILDSYITCFKLTGLGVGTLRSAIGEIFAKTGTLDDTLPLVGCPPEICARVQQLELVEKEALIEEMRAWVLARCAPLLREFLSGIEYERNDITYIGTRAHRMAQTEINVAENLLICEARFPEFNSALVNELLYQVSDQLATEVETTVRRQIEGSDLGAIARRDPKKAIRQMRRDQSVETTLVNDVMYDLREKGYLGTESYFERIKEITSRTLFLVRRYYEQEICDLVVGGHICHDRTKTLEENIRYSATLVATAPIQSLLLADYVYFGGGVYQEFEVRNFWRTLRERDPIPASLGPHQDFVEMTLLRGYGGHLAGYAPSSPLPSRLSGEPIAPEIVLIILGYTLPARVHLRTPDSILDGQWTFRTGYSDSIEWGSHYMNLCRVSKNVRDMTQGLLMSRTELKVIPGMDRIHQRTEGVIRSAGPRLRRTTFPDDTKKSFPIELRHRIATTMFSQIKVLRLDLQNIVLETDSSGIYPVLDSLTGLEQLRIDLLDEFSDNEPFLWTRKGQVEGWVMQTFSHIRASLDVKVYFDNEPSSIALDTWRQDGRNYHATVIGAWVSLLHEAFVADRRETASLPPTYQRSELSQNVLVMHPAVYAHDWRAKCVQRQQDWLREHGHDEEASRLGEWDSEVEDN